MRWAILGATLVFGNLIFWLLASYITRSACN